MFTLFGQNCVVAVTAPSLSLRARQRHPRQSRSPPVESLSSPVKVKRTVDPGVTAVPLPEPLMSCCAWWLKRYGVSSHPF